MSIKEDWDDIKVEEKHMVIIREDRTFEGLAIIALIIFIFLSLFSNAVFATYTIFDNVNITKNLTVMGLAVASCDVKAYTNGTLYCGTDATGTGGGVNFWQNSTDWMWPNTTAGGKTSVNVTIFNATTINQGGNKVLDISGGITWGNLSSWNLNVLWTGSLGWGNLTGYDLNKAWSNTLGAGNLTSGTLSNASLISTFKISLGNITDIANCTSAQKVIGKVSGAWACDTDLFNTSTQVDTSINATANRYFQLKVNESAYLSGQLSTYYVNSTNSSVVYKDSANISNSTLYFGGRISTYYWNQSGNIPFSNITDIANCSAGQLVQGKIGNVWVCVVDSQGSGTNYWQTDSSAWMWANTTSGGYNSLNITTLNATTIRQGGNKVLDISGGLTWANISSGWSLNQLWTGTLGGANITTGTVTSTQIADGTIATTDLAVGFAINFGNISAGWDLNKLWTNNLGGGNITSATITATQLANGAVGNAQIAAGAVNNTQITNAAINNTQLRNYVINNTQINLASINQSQLTQGFAIILGNVTDVTDCTAAQKVTGKTGSSWDCGTDLFNTSTEIVTAINATANRYFQLKTNESVYLNNQLSSYYLNTGGFNAGNLTSGTITNINITGTGWVNSSAGGKYNNNTKVYFGTQGQFCIYYNSTLNALVSTNNC